jgi:O-antigen ligase
MVFIGIADRLGRRMGALAKLMGFGALVGGLIVILRAGLLDQSAGGRVESWAAGLRMFKASPVWGVGLGFYMDHHPYVAHNSYVQCFAEVGFVGFTLWLAIILSTLRELNVVRRELADVPEASGLVRQATACKLSLAGFLTGALFLSRTYSPFLFLLVALGTALGAAARAQHPELPSEHPLLLLGRAGLAAMGIILTCLLVVFVGL